MLNGLGFFFFFSSRRRHTRCSRDWSSDVCSSDLLRRTVDAGLLAGGEERQRHHQRGACRRDRATVAAAAPAASSRSAPAARGPDRGSKRAPPWAGLVPPASRLGPVPTTVRVCPPGGSPPPQ